MPTEIPELAANGADPGEQIQAGIRWALSPANVGRDYEVVIRSGVALRQKWSKLRAAAKRVERERSRPGSETTRSRIERIARGDF